MKNMLLAAVIFCAASVFATESTCTYTPLSTLISDEMPLNPENIALGLPIHAYMAAPSVWFWGNQYEHTGRYLDGYITTTMFKNEQCPSFQEVSFCNETGEATQRLISDIWRAETLHGKKYIIFYYQTFRVYSSSDDQFVIAN
jgi:hypothetical protein